MPREQIAAVWRTDSGGVEIELANRRSYEFDIDPVERIDDRTVHITGRYRMNPLQRTYSFDFVVRRAPRPRPRIVAWREVVKAVRAGRIL
jgi:hypothetical protein